MAFDPDSATQALINQMLQEDLRLADAQPSTSDYQPPAPFLRPQSYQRSDEDLYGNASEEEDEERSMRESDGEDHEEKENRNDENDEDAENEQDDDAEGDEVNDRDEDDDSSIDSFKITGEVLEAMRDMERISQERGVPITQIYASHHGCSVEQAVVHLEYMQSILNPALPASTDSHSSNTQFTTQQHLESTTVPDPMLPIASSPFSSQFRSPHTPAFIPHHIAPPNPTLRSSDDSTHPPPPTTTWSTQPPPNNLVDWNALPPAEYLDGGLIGPPPWPSTTRSTHLDRTFLHPPAHLDSDLIGPPTSLTTTTPLPPPRAAAEPFAHAHPSRPFPLRAPPLASASTTTSSYPTRPQPPPIAQRRHQRSRRVPGEGVFRIRDRVVEDEMGRFVLVPWGDGGRGGKEGGVVEIRVGEGETVGGSLGGEGGV